MLLETIENIIKQGNKENILNMLIILHTYFGYVS